MLIYIDTECVCVCMYTFCIVLNVKRLDCCCVFFLLLMMFLSHAAVEKIVVKFVLNEEETNRLRGLFFCLFCFKHTTWCQS